MGKKSVSYYKQQENKHLRSLPKYAKYIWEFTFNSTRNMLLENGTYTYRKTKQSGAQ